MRQFLDLFMNRPKQSTSMGPRVSSSVIVKYRSVRNIQQSPASVSRLSGESVLPAAAPLEPDWWRLFRLSPPFLRHFACSPLPANPTSLIFHHSLGEHWAELWPKNWHSSWWGHLCTSIRPHFPTCTPHSPDSHLQTSNEHTWNINPLLFMNLFSGQTAPNEAS